MSKMRFFNSKEAIPSKNNELTHFPAFCGIPEISMRWRETRTSGRGVETVTRGLHNITDVIRGIRYPVSATDTI